MVSRNSQRFAASRPLPALLDRRFDFCYTSSGFMPVLGTTSRGDLQRSRPVFLATGTTPQAPRPATPPLGALFWTPFGAGNLAARRPVRELPQSLFGSVHGAA